MEVREYIDKIGENKNPEDMEKLGDMLAELIDMTEESHPELYEKYSTCLYEMAYGKVLTREMAEEWVGNMNPAGKWDFDTTTTVKNQYGLSTIDDISFYTVMNMLYSDMNVVLGNGDTKESLDKYVQATKAWLNDEDVGSDKLFNYWKYIANN